MEGLTCNFISGAIGGVGLVAVGQPFDTVKTKMQTFPELYQKSGAWNCARSVYKMEGVRGLYAGSAPAILVNVAENSVLFGARSFTIGITKSICQKENLSDFEMAMAGSGAAFFSSIVVCPTELIKTRMQAASELTGTGTFVNKKKATIRSTFKQVISEGYTAPFRGMTGTWARECPGYLVLFYTYQKCYKFIEEQNIFNNNFNAALSGGIAGGGYWICMLPIDTVKSRQQVLSIGSKVAIKVLPCIKDLYYKAGISSFYSGLMPMMLRTIPANGALFGLVEYTEPIIRKTLYN